MIKIDDKTRVFQHRKGETKTKQVGKLIHNPNANGSPEKREPFLYIGGACLTAGDCEEIATWLRHMASVHAARVLMAEYQRSHTPAKKRHIGGLLYVTPRMK